MGSYYTPPPEASGFNKLLRENHILKSHCFTSFSPLTLIATLAYQRPYIYCNVETLHSIHALVSQQCGGISRHAEANCQRRNPDKSLSRARRNAARYLMQRCGVAPTLFTLQRCMQAPVKGLSSCCSARDSKKYSHTHQRPPASLIHINCEFPTL